MAEILQGLLAGTLIGFWVYFLGEIFIPQEWLNAKFTLWAKHD